MNKLLPGIVVTGASGFIGRHFVIAVSGKIRLFCIARRSQKEAGVPHNDNTHWLQADITKWKDLLKALNILKIMAVWIMFYILPVIIFNREYDQPSKRLEVPQ